MLNLDDVLARVPEAVSRDSEGELVVVLPEKGKFIVLNGTGAQVFLAIDGERTLGQVATDLSDRYDVPLERVESDVLALAEKLIDREVVCRPQVS